MSQAVAVGRRSGAAYGFLLRELVVRDFRGRYAGSALGFLWSFVQPLWMLLLFSFVFAAVMRIKLPGEQTANFGVFLFAGLLPWMAIQEGVSRGAVAISDNAQLVKKINFRSEVLVLAVVLAALLHEAIALGLFLVVLAVIGELSVSSLPWLVVALPLQILLTLGLALMSSAINVFFRDVPQIVAMVFGAWFYFTPIVYPLGLVPDRYRPLLELNPLTALVDLYRGALLGGGLELSAGTAGLVGWSLVLGCAGLWLFRRLRPAFVDHI